ncbi:photosystem I assembly protein Ycf3 [mine drainage metagenome]|uniref:Photosystem I assembly protein Ycf3 n=1 Tax=mine drainage metagenome TaxID=410659 RepID=A0A1J5RYK1_9ZZZZ
MSGGRPPEARKAFAEGAARQAAGDARGAVAAYHRAVSLDPHYAEAYCNLGLVLFELGARAPALAAYRAALALSPGFVEAHNNLGNALLRLDQPQQAAAHFRTAIALDPARPQPHSNLGQALLELGEPAAAEAAHRAALALDAALPDAVNDLGLALARQNRCEEALEQFERALALAPETPRFAVNRALTLLKLGRFDEGWQAYRSRWAARPAGDRQAFSQPEWEGGPLAGRTLLLYGEQGYGDSLQFVRLLSRLPRDGRVLLRLPGPLVRLLAGQGYPLAAVLDEALPPPPFDCHASLMDLARLLRLELADLPGPCPYLRADAALQAAWRQRLAALPGRKAGLVWAGNPRPWHDEASRLDRRRSLPPRLLEAALRGCPGLTLVSLQKEAAERPNLPLRDWSAELSDFADTAALVAALDLVVTVDTAVAHLAGALGKPVWILSRFDGCWRWLRNRDDSPWYPTARLYRQTAPDDWTAPLARLRQDLEVFSARG